MHDICLKSSVHPIANLTSPAQVCKRLPACLRLVKSTQLPPEVPSQDGVHQAYAGHTGSPILPLDSCAGSLSRQSLRVGVEGLQVAGLKG